MAADEAVLNIKKEKIQKNPPGKKIYSLLSRVSWYMPPHLAFSTELGNRQYSVSPIVDSPIDRGLDPISDSPKVSRTIGLSEVQYCLSEIYVSPIVLS